MKTPADFALIGPTASGKSALAIALAKKYNANILSLDSLAIYKHIDIASAKPSLEEREGIPHFGIDVLEPSEHFSVHTFALLYQEARKKSQVEDKGLIIVGGTSFYLKVLLDGISKHPSISDAVREKVTLALTNLHEAHTLLGNIDNTYMRNIESNDSYRIEKALQIYYATGMTPSQYFLENPPQKIIETSLPIYQIVVDKTLLRERITKRTKQMITQGLIDEVVMLEKNYTRAPNSMKAIGIKETLAYLDGYYTKRVLIEKIITNTARLAKRQNTFNASQFSEVIQGELEQLEQTLL